MTSQATGIESAFRLAPGRWLTWRQLEPNLVEASPSELLAKTARDFPAPFRYARTASGVFLMVEYPLPWGDDAQQAAQLALANWVRTEHAEQSDRARGTRPTDIDEESVETVLAELAEHWSRRENVWVAAASSELPVELVIRPSPGGVRVEANLAELDDSGAATRDAQMEFLCRAQSALRFARIEVDKSVRVVSQVASSSLDDQLPLGLRGVAEACRGLTNEVRALADAELARAYLAGAQRREPGSSPRTASTWATV